jgi:carbamoyltransferase
LPAPVGADITADKWEGLRTLYVQRAPLFVRAALGWQGDFRWVKHHVAHAASATFCSGFDPCSVLVLDGRGEVASHLAGHFSDGSLDVLATQTLPHSLGLLYEELTAHLGFRRSSDEYKVMAMASYGEPAFLEDLRDLVYADGVGGFRVEPFDLSRFAPPMAPGQEFSVAHAALACSVQRRLEEVLLDLAAWLHRRTGDDDLVLAGGVALNCVANSRLWREGPFSQVWVQPASGDSGTALGAALQVARDLGGGGTVHGGGGVLRTRRHRRCRRVDPRRGRRGGVVPGPLRVRPARARPPVAARRSAAAGEPREAQ